MYKIKQVVLLAGLVFLTGCSTTIINKNSRPIVLPNSATLGVVPMENHTQTPQAGEKVAAIAAGVLQVRKARNIPIYHNKTACEKILSCAATYPSTATIFNWAEKHNLDYVILGSVNEWSYKVGLDGEPEINITLSVVNVASGKTIWTAVGSKTGGSRSGLGDIGHDLIKKMLSSILI